MPVHRSRDHAQLGDSHRNGPVRGQSSSSVFVGDFGLYSGTFAEETMKRREQTSSQVQEEIVIELLKDFPDNVTAFAFHGHVTKTDYDTVLIPDFEDRLGRHKKLRIYFEIAPDFARFDPGAVWEDTKFGFGHFFDWERCAVVTDVEWAKHVAKFSEFFGFLWPGEYRAFPEAEASKAREWIVEAQQ